MFSQEDIRRIALDVVSAPDVVPPGKRGAFLLVADQSGVKGVLAAKIGARWTVTEVVEHPWTGGLKHGATLKASW